MRDNVSAIMISEVVVGDGSKPGYAQTMANMVGGYSCWWDKQAMVGADTNSLNYSNEWQSCYYWQPTHGEWYTREAVALLLAAPRYGGEVCVRGCYC
jgi:hypothetical protein